MYDPRRHMTDKECLALDRSLADAQRIARRMSAIGYDNPWTAAVKLSSELKLAGAKDKDDA